MTVESATAIPALDAQRPEFDRIAEFRAVLDGTSTRPFLTSAWQHFVGQEYAPETLAAATIGFNRRWDWDWVKINPRAVYYSEAWGSVYDPADYAGVIPRLISPAIRGTGDLQSIRPLDPRTEHTLAEHLASARLIRQGLPDRPVLQTVFSPLSVLYQLAGLPLYPDDVVAGSHAALAHQDLLTDDPRAAHTALGAIAQTLARYIRLLLTPLTEGGAGLDGIFYAVTGTPNPQLTSPDAFDESSRPYDLQVLEAAGTSAVVLHTCGPRSHPEWFAHYPVDALHWDRFEAGNPPLDADLGNPSLTLVAGPHHELFATGSGAAAASQLRDTLDSPVGRPFLLAPSCTVPTPADDAALRRLRAAD